MKNKKQKKQNKNRKHNENKIKTHHNTIKNQFNLK